MRPLSYWNPCFALPLKFGPGVFQMLNEGSSIKNSPINWCFNILGVWFSQIFIHPQKCETTFIFHVRLPILHLARNFEEILLSSSWWCPISKKNRGAKKKTIKSLAPTWGAQFQFVKSGSIWPVFFGWRPQLILELRAEMGWRKTTARSMIGL